MTARITSYNVCYTKLLRIWTAPSNVLIIAQDIYSALSSLDPENAAYYKKNLDTFIGTIEDTDKQIRRILSSVPEESSFMVFHPAWGYFAQSYHLHQMPVEIEGKEPKPKELMQLIKKAREEHVKAIFTQPEFSDATANIISRITSYNVCYTKLLRVIQPTGKSYRIPMATIGHWNNDGIMFEEYLFWDNGEFMKQIGLSQ